MTCQYAIPYLSDDLPVHRLRIHGAAELSMTPLINNDDPAQEAYEFEVSMAGYYSDPVEDAGKRRDATIRAAMTKTTTQTCFARANQPLFKSILSSARLRTGGFSRFFIDGEYTFPFEPTQNGSCIEINHLGFNSTQRQATTTTRAAQPTQDSTRKRNKQKNVSTITSESPAKKPVTPKNKNNSGPVHASSVTSSSTTPYAGSSVRATPSTITAVEQAAITPALNDEDFFDLESSDNDDFTISPSQLQMGQRGPRPDSPSQVQGEKVVTTTDSLSQVQKGKRAATITSPSPVQKGKRAATTNSPSQIQKGKRMPVAKDHDEPIRHSKRQKTPIAKGAKPHSTVQEEAEQVGFGASEDRGDRDN